MNWSYNGAMHYCISVLLHILVVGRDGKQKSLPRGAELLSSVCLKEILKRPLEFDGSREY